MSIMASYRNLEEAEVNAYDLQKKAPSESLVMENNDLHPDIYISSTYLFVSYATKISAWISIVLFYFFHILKCFCSLIL